MFPSKKIWNLLWNSFFLFYIPHIGVSLAMAFHFYTHIGLKSILKVLVLIFYIFPTSGYVLQRILNMSIAYIRLAFENASIRKCLITLFFMAHRLPHNNSHRVVVLKPSHRRFFHILGFFMFSWRGENVVLFALDSQIFPFQFPPI